MEVTNNYFSRQPYTVSYYKDGAKKTIRRQPPPVLHNMLPTDKVILTSTKNDDFQEGSDFAIKNINPRNPNTIQIEDSQGNYTFVPYFDLKTDKKIAPRDGVAPEELPERTKYLTWP